LKHVHLLPFINLFLASFIGFPHAVHLVFSKNCICPHRLFSQASVSSFPQASHLTAPANVFPPQSGQTTVNGLPQPEHNALPR